MSLIRINTQPTRRHLRQFAGIVFPLFCALVGWIASSRFDAPRVAAAVWIIGALVAIVGLIRPAVARYVYLGLAFATYPIGFVVSHFVLLVIYYLIVTPVGIGLRLFGRDPLLKAPDASAASYWRRHEQIEDVEQYFRQY